MKKLILVLVMLAIAGVGFSQMTSQNKREINNFDREIKKVNKEIKSLARKLPKRDYIAEIELVELEHEYLCDSIFKIENNLKSLAIVIDSAEGQKKAILKKKAREMEKKIKSLAKDSKSLIEEWISLEKKESRHKTKEQRAVIKEKTIRLDTLIARRARKFDKYNNDVDKARLTKRETRERKNRLGVEREELGIVKLKSIDVDADPVKGYAGCAVNNSDTEWCEFLVKSSDEMIEIVDFNLEPGKKLYYNLLPGKYICYCKAYKQGGGLVHEDSHIFTVRPQKHYLSGEGWTHWFLKWR